MVFFFGRGSPDSSRTTSSSSTSSGSISGSVSSTTFPSTILTVLVLYSAARSALCDTMMTRRSSATSFNRFITILPLSVSSAPVGSSARIIAGLLTSALAIATLCICPPDNWLGFLYAGSSSPTFFNASRAIASHSAFLRPASVKASSTLESTLRCGIRL